MSIGICPDFREICGKGERQLCADAPHAEGEPVCKPGSVLSDHLSVALRCRRAQAASSERPGRPVCSSTALLRIEFTARTCLHAADGRLSPPFHPYCRMHAAAVYLCCTCPRVTPGGRYPLSLPYGARTFLTHFLSECARGRSACSHARLYPLTRALSRKTLSFAAIETIIKRSGRCLI